MDHLSDAFGSLSTSAPEWKPKPAGPQQNQRSSSSLLKSTLAEWPSESSDLKATAVKEFVPGKGWSAGQQLQQHTSNQHEQQHHAQQQQHTQTQNHGGPSAGRGEGNAGYGQSSAYAGQLNVEEYHAVDATVAAGPAAAPPPFRSLHGLGLSDDLWRYYRAQTMEGLRQMDPKDPRHKAVPAPYCNAYCLDDTTVTSNGRVGGGSSRRRSFGYPSTTFQVTSREDGYLYCLRRFDNVKSASPKVCAAIFDRWSKLGNHPNLIQLDRCFIAQRALFFVHKYIPGAISLKERWDGPMSEAFLWSAITQFVSVLRRVHGANMAVRTMDMCHVLTKTDATQTRLRVYLNCIGVVDVIECETRKNVADLQRQDICNLGRLILGMATGTEISTQTDTATMSRCEQFCISNYSRELHNLCFTLIRSRVPPSITDVSRVLADRLLDELDESNLTLDRSDAALANEYESGRALRLLLKMGFVNERPEFGPNRRWAQSGDCYLLSLFRDYVFHQADGAGQPVMDLGHVVTALNKLDAADEEKIVLSSRDGKSLMVVTFADVARCLDSAYHELCAGSVSPSAIHY